MELQISLARLAAGRNFVSFPTAGFARSTPNLKQFRSELSASSAMPQMSHVHLKAVRFVTPNPESAKLATESCEF